MEKIYRFIIVALIIPCYSVSGQTKSDANTSAIFSELCFEAGMDFSRMNDTINQNFGSQPFITFHYDNYRSQQFRYTFFVTPIAIHQTLNSNRTSRQRFFHIEGGASASYALFNNFWISAGGGYAYRFLNQVKIGANAWQERSYQQPGLFFYGSADVWISTSTGIRLSSLIFTDGYTFKIGLFTNLDTIKKRLTKLAQ